LAPCWDLLLAIAPGETGTSLVLRNRAFLQRLRYRKRFFGPSRRLPPYLSSLRTSTRDSITPSLARCSDCGPILGYVPLADRDFLYILRVRDRSFEVPADVSQAAMWALVFAPIGRGCLHVRCPRAREMFLLMTWTSVGMSLLKSFSPPSVIGPQVTMESVFLVLAALVTVWAFGFRQVPSSDSGSGPVQSGDPAVYA